MDEQTENYRKSTRLNNFFLISKVDNEDSGRTSIQTNMFVQHVHLLHTERDMGFLAEYQNLQQSASFTGRNFYSYGILIYVNIRQTNNSC